MEPAPFASPTLWRAPSSATVRPPRASNERVESRAVRETLGKQGEEAGQLALFFFVSRSRGFTSRRSRVSRTAEIGRFSGLFAESNVTLKRPRPRYSLIYARPFEKADNAFDSTSSLGIVIYLRRFFIRNCD